MAKRLLGYFFALFFLASCTESQLAADVYKSIPHPGDQKSSGLFKVGKPYEVDGQWYTPQETYEYTETGIASWYGPGFHGNRTANGEIFDANELTAAHRTLQMPSLVRVTNLENGRSLVVRINDRGPFKRGRVIDLSKRAADLLGVTRMGTARVRIDLLTHESRQVAEAARLGRDTSGVEVALNENSQGRYIPASENSLQQGDIAAANVPGHVSGGKFFPDPVVQHYQIVPTNLYVQLGSFSNPENAQRYATNLKPYGALRVSKAVVKNKIFYRVQLGPFPKVEDADAMLSTLFANGLKQSIIVVE